MMLLLELELLLLGSFWFPLLSEEAEDDDGGGVAV